VLDTSDNMGNLDDFHVDEREAEAGSSNVSLVSLDARGDVRRMARRRLSPIWCPTFSLGSCSPRWSE
jgi:hypothetical protein